MYYIIPQSSQLTDDELISKNDFKFSEFWSDFQLVPLQCNNQSLCDAATKAAEERQQCKDGRDKSDPGMSDDVQKKITPWCNSSDTIMNELFPDQLDYLFTSPKKNPAGGELILVASLLHKPPNLGGIIQETRYCRIGMCVFISCRLVQNL